MKYSTIAMLTLSFSFCSQVVASSSITLNQMNDDLIKDRLKKAEMLSSKLVDIKSATLDFFIENNRFPVNKEELVADGFYFGNYNSIYGNEITYTVNSNTVKFSVNVNDVNTASIISGMLSASSSGSTVEYQFGKPSQASIVSTSLSRVWDGDPSRNTMTTNLIMDGNDLLEVNDIEANSVRAAGGVYDEGVRVFSEKNLPTKSHIGLSEVENYSVSDLYNGTRTDFYASEKAVGDSYRTLVAKIDALTKGDIGLPNVPNYAATNSYTSNNTNLFATQRAVNSAYIYLNKYKLGKNDTAVNSDRLDNLDSSAFARSSLTINGHKLTGSFILDKDDIGLSRVSNFAATSSYTGDSATLYATQRAVNHAWKDLNDKIANFEVKDADTLDGFDSSDFVKTSLKINGKALTSNISINKVDIGLSNVPNYSASNTYTSNRTDLFATQRAVYDAYTTLNNAKLDKNSKARDSDRVDGIDGASLVQTSRTINGKNLGSNINLTKADVGLSNVKNYTLSSSTTSSSPQQYATSLAVKRVSDKTVVTKKYGGVIMMCDPTTGYAISYGYHDFGGKGNYSAINASLKYYYKNIHSTLVTPRISSGGESTEWVIKQPSTTGQISSIHIVKISGGLDTNTTGLNWSIAGELYVKSTCNE